MDLVIDVALIVFAIIFVVVLIKSIIRAGHNTPTWTGIIISALLGMLAFYLILCFFGWMGEERE